MLIMCSDLQLPTQSRLPHKAYFWQSSQTWEYITNYKTRLTMNYPERNCSFQYPSGRHVICRSSRHVSKRVWDCTNRFISSGKELYPQRATISEDIGFPEEHTSASMRPRCNSTQFMAKVLRRLSQRDGSPMTFVGKRRCFRLSILCSGVDKLDALVLTLRIWNWRKLYLRCASPLTLTAPHIVLTCSKGHEKFWCEHCKPPSTLEEDIIWCFLPRGFHGGRMEKRHIRYRLSFHRQHVLGAAHIRRLFPWFLYFLVDDSWVLSLFVLNSHLYRVDCHNAGIDWTMKLSLQ